MKFIDLTGKIFGKLVCIKRGPNSLTATRWYCKCSCGIVKLVFARALRGGLTTSCGCHMRVSNLKHGHTANNKYSKEYRAWQDMKCRCLNSSHKWYYRYGGRGIKVCKNWLKFENFYRDMGNSPTGYLLDRLDNNDNYCKENCNWVTPKDSTNNRSTSLKYKSDKSA